jgi:hypothetical protein
MGKVLRQFALRSLAAHRPICRAPFSRSLTVIIWLAASFASSTVLGAGFVTGFGQFNKIADNPSAGRQQLFEWDLLIDRVKRLF